MKAINNEKETSTEKATISSRQSSTGEQSAQPQRNKMWWLDVIVIISTFLFSQFAGAFICILLGITPPATEFTGDIHTEEAAIAASEQARFITCTTLCAIVICLSIMTLYTRMRRLNKIIQFRTPGWASPFRLLCGYFLLWCFSIAIEPISEMLPGDQSMLGGGGWLLISAIFLAPFFEEIIFRGYMAGILRKACGVTVAWLFSSLLFGLAHGAPSIIVSATASGLILGFYYLRYRSLILVIMLHAMNNATACFLHTLGLSDVSIRELLGGGEIYWAVYALCLSISIIAIARMWQVTRELESNKYIA